MRESSSGASAARLPRRRGLAVAAGLGAWLVACGGGAPLSPSAASVAPSTIGTTGNATTLVNHSPMLQLKTRPRPDTSGPVWTISGVAPFEPSFNLCTSDDPDQVFLPDGSQAPGSDSLNWQFNFGEPANYVIAPDGTPTPDPAFSLDGHSFRPDFDHYCRTTHVYETPGTYVATVSVTDEHQEDQSRGVSALARQTQRVLVIVLSPEASPSGPCVPPNSTPFGDQCTDTTFAVAPNFSGSDLTYSATFDYFGCIASRGVVAMDALWSINPSTGVITVVNVGCSGAVAHVTATNACGSTSQSFELNTGCS
jgi:hypothetical protein